MKTVFIVLLLAIFPSFLLAQTDSQILIKGSVIDSVTSKPIAGVTVSLSTHQTQPSTITDSAGRFELRTAASAASALQLSSVGYKTRTVSLPQNPSDLGALWLSIDASVMKAVVVNAQKQLVEQLADRLVYHADRDASTTGGTAADVLRNVPMLSVDPNGNVMLRGSSNLRVLINNRPSTIMASSVADALRQLPAELVKTVEVITSPSARYDAEGTAGIINIITKKNTLQGVTGTASVTPGNVSTIGSASLNFRRRKYGLSSNISTNQFYNHGKTHLERRDLRDGTTLVQDGITKNRSGFITPQLGFDVTLNDRNSISGGILYNPYHDRVRNQRTLYETKSGSPINAYRIDMLNETIQRGFDYNLDYLRTFKDPQREFSILTLLSTTRTDNESNQDRYAQNAEVDYLQRNLNQSRNREATIQSDYTHPFRNKTTVEVGAKTILRHASSDVQYRNIFPLSGGENQAENIFSYDQNVWASYLSYNFKAWKKLNVKLGGRYEHTLVDANFETQKTTLRTSYDNWIPSLNASYTFKEKHSFRIGYTQRLQRPQLFFLNPYREVIAPQVIQYGNPSLDAEVAKLAEVAYSFYGPKFSFNSSVYTRVTNNAIATRLTLENDTTFITFLNIASNKNYGLNLSGSFKPFKRWTLNSNASLYYAELDGVGQSNSGWMYTFFFTSVLDLGKGWYHNFTGSFASRRVILQGRLASFYYHNTTLRKDILKKKGSVGINLANPLMKGTRFRNYLATPTFEQTEDNINYTRGIRASFIYRFGKLTQNKQPRKARKSISNDDAVRQ